MRASVEHRFPERGLALARLLATLPATLAQFLGARPSRLSLFRQFPRNTELVDQVRTQNQTKEEKLMAKKETKKPAKPSVAKPTKVVSKANLKFGIKW